MLDFDEYAYLETALADLEQHDVKLHALVEFAAEIGASIDELAQKAVNNHQLIRDIAWRALHLGRGDGERRVYITDRAMAHLPWLALPHHDELDDLRIAWGLAMTARNAPVGLDDAIRELHRYRVAARTDVDDEVPF